MTLQKNYSTTLMLIEIPALHSSISTCHGNPSTFMAQLTTNAPYVAHSMDFIRSDPHDSDQCCSDKIHTVQILSGIFSGRVLFHKLYHICNNETPRAWDV